MKRFKSLSVVLIVLVLVLSLMACNSKDTNDPNKDLGQVEEEVIEDENDLEDKVEEEAEEPLEEAIDPIDQVIDSSDYISKIKLIEKGKDNIEIKILDNIRGTLNSTDLPPMENLELHRTYIVFMINSGDKVVLTDEKYGVLHLEGDNHELFEKINKQHNN